MLAKTDFFCKLLPAPTASPPPKRPTGRGLKCFTPEAGGVLEELKLHQDYAAEWGVDLGAVAPAPATRRYTDFLLATAWGVDVGLTAAAMSPCMRLYAFLGQKLALGRHSRAPLCRLDSHLQQRRIRAFGQTAGKTGRQVCLRGAGGALNLSLRNAVRARFLSGGVGI